MDKRYQVFVSSTFEDLQEERKEVMQALLELDCIPAGMELFPASNDDQWTLIKRMIDDCDYYILIIGGRYGSENDKGISYTQMEFEYALETGKPIISFLPKDPDTIPAGKSDKVPEKAEKLKEFKELAKKKLVRFWTTPENLGSVVSRSMVKLIKDFPSEGWVKAGDAVDANSLNAIAQLQKENQELKNKLSKVATIAPEGTEQFAQGDDYVSLLIHCTTDGNESDGEEMAYNGSIPIYLTWNDIFRAIAPVMLFECPESKIISTLNSLIEKFKHQIIISKEDENLTSFMKYTFTNDAINQIKIQLRALGLIKIGKNKTNSLGSILYWSLTEYGDYMMTRLIAIRK